MPEHRIRRATVSDADIITRHRVEMFRDMGELPASDAPAVESASRERVARELAAGDYVGWLLEADGEVVAGAGVLFHAYYPMTGNLRGRPAAHIVNVYTEPAHRRQGHAGRLVAEILGWARANDIPRVTLNTSKFGRSVYERLGFAPGNGMRVILA